MRAKEWQRDALVASIVWVISGFYCGMHFPVANALSNYKHCLRDGIAASSDCHRNFIEEWNTYSGYRVHAGLAVALVPIPLIGLFCYAASRRRKTNSNSTVIFGNVPIDVELGSGLIQTQKAMMAADKKLSGFGDRESDLLNQPNDLIGFTP